MFRTLEPKSWRCTEMATTIHVNCTQFHSFKEKMKSIIGPDLRCASSSSQGRTESSASDSSSEPLLFFFLSFLSFLSFFLGFSSSSSFFSPSSSSSLLSSSSPSSSPPSSASPPCFPSPPSSSSSSSSLSSSSSSSPSSSVFCFFSVETTFSATYCRQKDSKIPWPHQPAVEAPMTPNQSSKSAARKSAQRCELDPQVCTPCIVEPVCI